MRETAKALKAFFGSFDVPAYSETSVPEDVSLPYITYPVREPEWNQKTTMYCVYWCRSKSYELALEAVDEIQAAIGHGVKIDIDGGYIVIYPETPFIQEMPDAGEAKGIYINLSMNAYHIPGV